MEKQNIPNNVREIMIGTFLEMSKEMVKADDSSLLTMDSFADRVYPRLTALNDNYSPFTLGIWTAMSWEILPSAVLDTVITYTLTK